MSQEEEIVPCDQCKEVPDNFLSLNCGHAFCLMCMAQNFLKGGRIFKMEGQENINYICTICEKDTELDEPSTLAIENVLKEIIMPALGKASEQTRQREAEQDNHNNHHNNHNNNNNSNNDIDEIIAETPKQQNYCEMHPKEETNLFCFTCETKCFCVKCLLKHENKAHEICNVSSCVKKLKSKMSDATHTIGASLELMQLQLKRVIDQDQIQQDEIESLVSRIGNQFKTLYQSLQSKEEEINNQIVNIRELHEKQSDKVAGEIQMKINSLMSLRSDFENISLSQSLQPSVSLLNYYSECKIIMKKVLGQVSFSDVFQSQKYFPDNDIFFKIDEFEQKVGQLKQQIDKFMVNQSQPRSISHHEKPNFYLSQRSHTQMDESTDSFKSHGVSVYSKLHTPLNTHQRVEDVKHITDRVKTQQKPYLFQQALADSAIQRSYSELNFKKQYSSLSALRLQQGLFDSRVTRKQKQLLK